MQWNKREISGGYLSSFSPPFEIVCQYPSLSLPIEAIQPKLTRFQFISFSNRRELSARKAGSKLYEQIIGLESSHHPLPIWYSYVVNNAVKTMGLSLHAGRLSCKLHEIYLSLSRNLLPESQVVFHSR